MGKERDNSHDRKSRAHFRRQQEHIQPSRYDEYEEYTDDTDAEYATYDEDYYVEDDTESYEEDPYGPIVYDDRPYPPRSRQYTSNIPSRSSRPAPSIRSQQSLPPTERVQLHPVSRSVKRRQRGFFPTLLIGCALGAFFVVAAAAIVVLFALHSLQPASGGNIIHLPGSLSSTKTFTANASQQVHLQHISHILVCDQTGNVTLQVDPNATTTTVASQKTVQATNQANADTAFQQINVAVQPDNVTSCSQSQNTSATATTTATANSTTNDTLTVTVAFPTTTTTTVTNTANLTISIPSSAIATSNGPSMQVDVEAPRGQINVQGLSGVLTIIGGVGNVSVTGGVLASGSHLETAQGNLTFNGFLAVPTTANTNQPAHYILQSEQNIDVTLPDTTNITLDANTNNGTVKSDFPIQVNNNTNGGPVSYDGPLNPSAGTPQPATLTLDVGTGNVTIHKMTQ
ncbi:MAG TPA: hypothetical protein VL461_12075 [Dictyobacter sp.]|jgi:hypothetical protein|nr:hypothetical protein [Dictyobacter sp.]